MTSNRNIKMDVSIIIVNWNTCDILRDCLHSVYEQTKEQELSFEVLVIDNASSDESTTMVKSEFPHVILIENNENRGFSAANNQGISLARGRYVLLLNSDTLVLDNAIQKTIKYADQQPDAAVVGCKVLNPDKTLQPTCYMFPSLLNLFLSTTYLYKIFPHSRFFGREHMTWWNRDDEREVDVVTGCFMLVRHEAIHQVGIMSEEYFMYSEDTDWCYRFKKAGWKNLFFSGAEIIHYGGQSSRKVKSKMNMQLRSSLLLFTYKKDGWLVYRISCFLVSIFYFIRIPYWFIKWLISNFNNDIYITLRTYIQGSYRALIGYQALGK